MKKTPLLLALATCFVLSFAPRSAEARGGWVGSLGAGMTFDPTAFLFNPQLEYGVKSWLLFGPNVQIATTSGTLFTASAAARFLLGHSYIKPDLEVGAGLAVASSKVGFLFHFGMGFDYGLARGVALGTMLRANFMPGIRNFMLSWTILSLRFSF